MPFQLNAETVVPYLRRRHVVGEMDLTVEALSGGVSNDVLGVAGVGVDLVVKQALPRLRVDLEWLAPTGRIIAEAGALEVAERLTPGEVPAVVDLDTNDLVLTISRAARTLRNWKTDLLAGRIEPDTAVSLGRALARWHTVTAADADLVARFADSAFEELRVAPFYRWLLAGHPALAPQISRLINEMLASQLCLVHGDFSPKNVLADGPSICVLDWEVAHIGDPVFDLAFLPTHLLLKAIHHPALVAEYRGLAEAFLSTYDDLVGADLRRPDDYLAAHTACLTLARVDGKSPVEYLTAPEQERARALAVAGLADHDDTIWQMWERLI